MADIDVYERATVERRMLTLKQAVYELGIQDHREGKCSPKLREIMEELRTLRTILEGDRQASCS